MTTQMLRQIYHFALFLPIFLFISCSPDIEDLSWLEGSWQREYNDVTQIEDWRFEADSLIGISYFVRGNDSSIQETMVIYSDGADLVFNARIPEQNINTLFTQSDLDDQKISFENPMNDFPQTIVYQRKQDSLYAGIIGAVNGYDKSIVFGFSRLQ